MKDCDGRCISNEQETTLIMPFIFLACVSFNDAADENSNEKGGAISVFFAFFFDQAGLNHARTIDVKEVRLFRDILKSRFARARGFLRELFSQD